MTRAEHYRAAERWLAEAERIRADMMTPNGEAIFATQLATVHAVLATVDVDLDRERRDHPLCRCAFLPDPHLWGAGCPPLSPVPSDGPGQTA